jgi:hypothetical protein
MGQMFQPILRLTLLVVVEEQQVLPLQQWQGATEDFMVLVAVAVVAAVDLHLARAAMARKVLSL